MLPPCPGRFSTITVSPSAGPSRSASRRATMSVAWPGGKPTRMRVRSALRASVRLKTSAVTTTSKPRMSSPLILFYIVPAARSRSIS